MASQPERPLLPLVRVSLLTLPRLRAGFSVFVHPTTMRGSARILLRSVRCQSLKNPLHLTGGAACINSQRMCSHGRPGREWPECSSICSV